MRDRKPEASTDVVASYYTRSKGLVGSISTGTRSVRVANRDNGAHGRSFQKSGSRETPIIVDTFH